MTDMTPSRLNLLNAVSTVLLERGFSDLSLSAIARHAGTTNRMLLYYFGNRGDLIWEAADNALQRFPRLQRLFDDLDEPGPIEQRLLEAWDNLADPENLPFLRLFFEILGVASQQVDRFDRFRSVVGTDWTGKVAARLVVAGASVPRSRTQAEAIVALWRGLQLSLIIGTPRAQLDEAYVHALRTTLASVR